MASVKNMNKDSIKKEVLSAQKKLMEFQLQERRTHNHRDESTGRPTIRPVRECDNVKLADKNKMPDNIVGCTSCGDYFDISTFTKSQLEDAIFMLKSMMSQISLVSKLSDEEQMHLATNGFGSLDEVQSFVDYYINMTKQLANQNKGNGGKKNNKVKYGSMY